MAEHGTKWERIRRGDVAYGEIGIVETDQRHRADLFAGVTDDVRGEQHVRVLLTPEGDDRTVGDEGGTDVCDLREEKPGAAVVVVRDDRRVDYQVVPGGCVRPRGRRRAHRLDAQQPIPQVFHDLEERPRSWSFAPEPRDIDEGVDERFLCSPEEPGDAVGPGEDRARGEYAEYALLPPLRKTLPQVGGL